MIKMAKQLTLTKDSPKILDATCSYFHLWPRHATIRMDIRPECKPDIVGDIRKTDFLDNYFDEIYLDPPHMIRTDNGFMFPNDRMAVKRRLSGRTTPHSFDRYGVFKSIDEWYEFLDAINIEVFRIIKPGGILHFKVTSGKDKRVTKRNDLKRLTNFKVIKEKITKSKYPKSDNKVHWITYQSKHWKEND